MTTPIDELSFKMGEISAGLAILRQRDEKRDRQLDDLSTNVGEIKTRMKPLAEDVAWMKPQVRHYSTNRKRVAWVASALFTIGGAIGGGFGNYLMKKFDI